MTPQIDLSWKNKHCSEGLDTHLWVSKVIDGKTSIFFE